ncbi:MAG: hypothetical protein JXQ71_13290 [Verrucomicrobia bacterium]|nr:hypothetical protein [Verrucomicrobiota bacterium]
MKRSHALWSLLALAALAVAAWLGWRASPASNALRSREIATRALARHLAPSVSTSSGARRVLVIGNPFTQWPNLPPEMRDTESASWRGLELGFGPGAALVAGFPRLKPGARENPRSIPIDPVTTTPLSYLVAPDAFDELADAHADCDLIVSLIGLPAQLGEVACWRKPGPPAFALVLPDLRMVGGRQALREAMQRGKLLAFVLPHPQAPPSDVPPRRDWQAEFARRYVLVTADNVAERMQSHPHLFPEL